jgi:hypothetical protein
MSRSVSVTRPGAVEMIFRAVDRVCKSEVLNRPEAAQMSLEGRLNSATRSDNTLTDKSDQQVHLNPNAQEEVTTTGAPATAIGSREKWPGTPDGKRW